MATTYAVDLRLTHAGPATDVEHALVQAIARESELETERPPVVEDAGQDVVEVRLLVDADDSSIAELAACDLVRDALGGRDVVVRAPGAEAGHEPSPGATSVEIEPLGVRASS
jgi:hypothetical protein